MRPEPLLADYTAPLLRLLAFPIDWSRAQRAPRVYRIPRPHIQALRVGKADYTQPTLVHLLDFLSSNNEDSYTSLAISHVFWIVALMVNRNNLSIYVILHTVPHILKL